MSVVMLCVVLLVSYIIIVIGVVALEMTGLESGTAWFQALSAYTGTGFTTRVSERITGHPVRRKIITYLIILGNFGLVSVISTIVVSARHFDMGLHAAHLAVVILAFFLLHRLTIHFPPMAKTLKWLTRLLGNKLGLDKVHYEVILAQSETHGVASVTIGPQSPRIGSTLKESGFVERGLRVLSIQRDEEILTAPHNAVLMAGDRILFYGDLKNLVKKV